ncbi:MAG: N-formylglutamate amidohydrolase [Deltaproteobacteria bacterium]|uniref:N-formylglutamate amidohydrolase n=1 Tax=Desulfobacula sp. TaxID=2593537 RepID=UPI001982BE17|nr:N-formylglutamate amidohydrolase [Candidatus Desulfobacula maris]MBL6994826.1 N-formylglutamate amidohydrolase [Desulfobacula sp.]
MNNKKKAGPQQLANIIERTDPLKGFAYRLDFSLPFIATAIHAGHHVREELRPLMAIDSDQRKFEEDPCTDLMIKGLSNAVWALESRAVCDLNRSREIALPLTPERFWGTLVYKTLPSPEMNHKSLENYESFYRFMETCIANLLDRFGICIIYDIHSYNISRQQAKGIESPPVFNLGTALLDKSKWKSAIELWLEQLGTISLPGIKTSVAENYVFSGKAEFCRRLCRLDDRILVLPTEVSKVYMDEKKGNVYPEKLQAFKNGLQNAILSHVQLLKKLNPL